MKTFKLIVRLPKIDLRSLQSGIGAIHPEVEKISSLISENLDAKAEYREHIPRKHR